ncbi:MAG: hypothetical protein OCD02_15530 [Spirochaetaceae bacterium]
MKKIMITSFLLIFISVLAWSQSAGTGFSVFVPESLYLLGDGSVSMEQSLEFELGLGSVFSLPIGVTYNTNYGLMVDDEAEAEHPWFYSDSIMPYVMLKAHIPIGPLYIEAFAGGAVNYNLTLRPIEGNIEKDLSTTDSQAVFEDDSLEYENSVGYGYLAGGSIGVKIGDISVDVSVTYRNIWHQLNLVGEYSSISQVDSGLEYESDAELMMRGLSIGLGGSFSF